MEFYIAMILMAVVSIMFYRNYYLRNKDYFKKNGIFSFPDDKYKALVIPAMFPFLATLMIASIQLFGTGANNSNNKDNSSSTQTIYHEQDDGKCSRCFGRKKVATYSSVTCDSSHFSYGDCIGGHKSEYNCFAVGSKTCPCCNGSGRKS